MTRSGYIQGVEDAAVIEASEVNLVAALKAKIFIDGNMWCWLHGDNLQDGISGFGKSPYLAALDFNKAFYATLSDLPPPPNNAKVAEGESE